ncbi:MAG: alkaline phosphatase family protein [Gemmatimonadaceae bacterium]
MTSSSRFTRAGTALAALLVISLVAATSATSSTAPVPAPRKPGHIFILILENESFARTFADNSPAPYLAHTLAGQGVLLRKYYGIGHNSLDNYIALISGQAPNLATMGDCPKFTAFALTQPKLDENGQAIGSGCVYPTMVPMLGDQLETAGKSWRGYMQDLGNDKNKEVEECGHPAIGTTDGTTRRSPADQYATKHNPFYYFHTLIDDKDRCVKHVVNLNHLPDDLKSVNTTPNFSFITPNLCDDGHDAPCIDKAPGGLVQADGFLRKWVPKILESPAFKQDGVLIIMFDEASGPPGKDSSACCGEKSLPGSPKPAGGDGPGGGITGAVVLSPFVTAGAVSDVPYNHYSTLRWLEDQFGVPHLGYAAAKGLVTFGDDVFARPTATHGKARAH